MNHKFNWVRFNASLDALQAGKRARSASKTAAPLVESAPTVHTQPIPAALPLPAAAVPVQTVPVLSAEAVEAAERLATDASVRRIVANSNPSLLSAGDRWNTLPEAARRVLSNYDAGRYTPRSENS